MIARTDISEDLPTPAGARAVLRRFGIRPLHRFGQHFMVSRRALDAIIDAAGLSRQDDVLEIGPGLGTLTRPLSGAAGCVTAVELDRRLVPVLEAVLAGASNVRILQGDALAMPPASLFSGPPGATRKLVSNLPYNIAAAAVVRFLDPGLGVRRLVVTVQREVAERITAAPATPAYGRLSVAVQFRSRARLVARLPPGAFLPPPEVESTVVEMVALDAPPVRVPDDEEFLRIVAAGFGQRRKTLQNALSHGLARPVAVIAAACAEAGVDPRARAETLGLAEFGGLARALHPLPAAESSRT